MARIPLTTAERATGALLGETLRNRRAVVAMSREHVARKADISVETLRKAEHGSSPGISFLVVHRICHVLGLGLDELARTVTTSTEGTGQP